MILVLCAATRSPAANRPSPRRASRVPRSPAPGSAGAARLAPPAAPDHSPDSDRPAPPCPADADQMSVAFRVVIATQANSDKDHVAYSTGISLLISDRSMPWRLRTIRAVT